MGVGTEKNLKERIIELQGKLYGGDILTFVGLESNLKQINVSDTKVEYHPSLMIYKVVNHLNNRKFIFWGSTWTF